MSKTVNLDIPKDAAERVRRQDERRGLVGATEYLKEFEKNCPKVQMTIEECEELRRLFSIALQS